MSDNSSTRENPLDLAELQLREICESSGKFDDAIDTSSLNRMLAHIHNINASVCASTRDHVNAAKRLNDFSVTLGRLATKSSAVNSELAARIETVAGTLRNAGAEIADGAAMPRWTSPATSRSSDQV